MTAPAAGRRALTWLLVLACSLLTVKIHQLATEPERSAIALSPAHSDTASPPPVTQDDGLTIPPLTEMAETLNRPLFRPDRRPAQPAEEPLDQPAEPSPQPASRRSTATLLGTIVSPSQRLALIRPSGQKAPTWVLEGDTIDDWRIVAIETDSLALAQGDEVDRLTLDRKGPIAIGVEATQRK